MTLRDCFTQTRKVSCAARGPAVEMTVARALLRDLAPGASLSPCAGPDGAPDTGALHIAVSPDPSGNGRSMTAQILPDGTGRLTATDPQGLYSLYGLVCDRWLGREAAPFASGVTVRPSFDWLRNLNDFLVGSLRSARRFEREAYIRQLARAGFTHVTVNGLGVARPLEWGPPGDVYGLFYDYSPDLDQFVEGPLTRGYYPADYLQANLAFLKRNASFARAYGLVPGLHINSPRSMPEEFWHRYGFLRGARIDHPRESFRPRYTLAMAHPAVQEHYRALMRAVMREVPEIGFIHLWTNDSGAGFEFVSSLYAGRNGGPYLIREWKDEAELARAAARNVLSYLRLLRDEGRRVNPAFRLVCDMGPYFTERTHIIEGMDEGIDAGEFGFFGAQGADQERLARAGVGVHIKVDGGGTNVLGVPFPRLLFERLQKARGSAGCRGILLDLTPASLAPFDVNGEVVRSLQLEPGAEIDEILRRAALRWAGPDRSAALLEIWDAADRAVRAFPPGVPASTFGFPWFRFWVRPIVPDIDAIPEPERAYYEKYLVATFNNPARVDLNNDMLWNFLTVGEAARKVRAIDEEVLPLLEGAVSRCAGLLGSPSLLDPARALFLDLRDRLAAYRCFVTTLRSCMAWTEAVHGYLQAAGVEEKQAAYRRKARAVVERELENTAALLELWERGTTEFMPVSALTETAHLYGENFGELLKRKITLMQRHMNDVPRVDPDYMWRMPNEDLQRAP